MEVLKVLKGGSLSKTEIVLDEGKKIVRKSISRADNREYGLVRWQSQIRKLQTLNRYIPDSSVIIERMGVNERFYYYDMPYYENAVNCAELLMGGGAPDLIVDQISQLLSKMAAVNYSSARGSLSVYVSEEIESPLRTALKTAEENLLPLSKSEQEFFLDAIHRALILIKKLIKEIKKYQVQETLNHGNLTLENILWSQDSQRILMIDPYSETYCDNIMGDVSQLLQSTDSGYEYISTLFQTEKIDIKNYPSEKIPSTFLEFSIKLKKNLAKEPWYSTEHLMLLHASQFTRMFPFKLVTAPMHGVSFMLHGIDILEKIKC